MWPLLELFDPNSQDFEARYAGALLVAQFMIDVKLIRQSLVSMAVKDDDDV